MTAQNKFGFSRKLMEHAVRPCATASFFVFLAFLWTLFLQHNFAYPFVFLFFGAVMVSAWFGGAVAGLVSVILSTLLIDYFFIPPFFSWSIDKTAETYFVAFVVCASTVSWVISTKKQSETAIRQARDLLEQRVQERTAELQRSYAEIRESERQLRLLTEAIPQQIWSAGTDGAVDYCNQHLLAYIGRAMDEMHGPGYFGVFHADDLNLFRQTWNLAFASGKKFEGEWRIRGWDGRYRWFLVRGTPQESLDGQITRWYGTHIDIEERHRTEQALIAAQSELASLSHSLSMGELAASIMHEINQPLTAVITHAYACLEWLRGTPSNMERASSTAEKIVQESTRAGAVVARVRALFQKEPPAKERVEINVVIRNLVRILRDESIRREVAIGMDLEENLPHVEVDRIQIEQVLLNLAINGMDAMMNIQGPRELVIASSSTSAREILVRVEDHGDGLDPETAGMIFEPFVTTKTDGLGMGLSISRSIIEAHDGKLWASPRPGGGTIFQFTIPVQ